MIIIVIMIADSDNIVDDVILMKMFNVVTINILIMTADFIE